MLLSCRAKVFVCACAAGCDEVVNPAHAGIEKATSDVGPFRPGLPGTLL